MIFNPTETQQFDYEQIRLFRSFSFPVYLLLSVLAEVDASHDQLDAQWADRYEATSAPTREYERDQRSQPKSPPQFAQQPVISSTDVLEGEPIRIEAQLVPTSDATLHVEWLHDGRPVGTG